MEDVDKKISDFFNRYARTFNLALQTATPDVEETACAFADFFIEANPKGVNCAKNNKNFRAIIPRGYEFYKSIGIIAMYIFAKEITLLDDYHAMIKINWRWEYAKKDNTRGDLLFDVIYFVQLLKGGCKIFAYITGDEQAAFKAKGLI